VDASQLDAAADDYMQPIDEGTATPKCDSVFGEQAGFIYLTVLVGSGS